MLFPLCLLVCICAVIGFAMLVHAAFAAPHAVEDERGFHLASPPEAEVAATLPVPAVNTADLAFFHR